MDEAEGLQGLVVGITADVLPCLIHLTIHIQVAKCFKDAGSECYIMTYWSWVR